MGRRFLGLGETYPFYIEEVKGLRSVNPVGITELVCNDDSCTNTNSYIVRLLNSQTLELARY